MRHWLLNYFLHDFVPSRELRITLTSFLNSMPFHPLIKQSPRDQRIIKGLKRVVRRLKKLYYASSSSSRVRVIDPPPLTDEQEQLQAMAREKISQTTIRQKTLNRVNGIHVDARHSNNTAIKNKQDASVVVIGTSNSSKTERQSRTRRRGSSTSSSSNPNINHSLPASLYNLHEGANDSATKEWYNLKQHKENCLKSQDFHSSNVSDNSLESVISPGTSAEVSEYEDEDDEDDDGSLSKASFHSKATPDQQSATSAPQLVSNELAEKLEQLRQQQQNEEIDEKTEAEIFLAAYSANPAATTAAIIHKTQSNFEDGLRARPFYNAQLAIPSAISTPEIYHPQQQQEQQQEQQQQNDFESSTSARDGMINSTSYNSMAYPSVTDSEVVTPSIDTGRSRLNSSYNQDHSKLLPLFPSQHHQNKRASKTWIDPKVKPLPLLVTSDDSLPSPPPNSNKKKDDKVEQWRMSVHQPDSPKGKEPQFSLKNSESNVTEVKQDDLNTGYL
jgi:hypothetical protein